MRRQYWLYGLLPAFIVYALFFVAPTVTFLRVSFNNSIGPGLIGNGGTIENFKEVLTESSYLASIQTTLTIAVLVAVISLIIAYPLAHMIARSRRWGNTIFLIVVLTLFGSTVVAALGWEVILGPTGPLSRVLINLHLIGAPLQLSESVTGVVIGLVQAVVPIMVLGILPVSEAVDPDLVTAAHGLGASEWYTFWRVVMPLTMRGAVTLLTLGFATTAGSFTTVAILGGGRVLTLPVLVQQEAMDILDYPLAAALSAVLLVGVFILVTAATYFSNRRSVAFSGGMSVR